MLELGHSSPRMMLSGLFANFLINTSSSRMWITVIGQAENSHPYLNNDP